MDAIIDTVRVMVTTARGMAAAAGNPSAKGVEVALLALATDLVATVGRTGDDNDRMMAAMVATFVGQNAATLAA